MKTSDIVQLKRDLTGAIDAAGRGEFRWFILLEKLDEMGYDLTRRAPTPEAITAAVEACTQIARTVDAALTMVPDPAEADRLFA